MAALYSATIDILDYFHWFPYVGYLGYPDGAVVKNLTVQETQEMWV